MENILSTDVVNNLLNAYVFLRDVEHRLQYWDDQQTQTLPENPKQRELLAQSMGFDDWYSFSDCLNAHRAFVNQEFNDILQDGNNEKETIHPLDVMWRELPESTDDVLDKLDKLGFANASEIVQKLSHLKVGQKYQSKK